MSVATFLGFFMILSALIFIVANTRMIIRKASPDGREQGRAVLLFISTIFAAALGVHLAIILLMVFAAGFEFVLPWILQSRNL